MHFQTYPITNLKPLILSRGLHSAIFSFIGAMGFLASAVLPASAYLVSGPIISSTHQSNENHRLILTPEPLWMPHSRSQWRLRLHPTPTRLVILQYQLNSRRRTRNRTQHLIRGPGPDRRCLDLQKRRSKDRISNRPLDKCGIASLCDSRLHSIEALLRVAQSPWRRGKKWKEFRVLDR